MTTADFTQYEGFDLLIGGSPCQGFSIAGKQLNFDDPRSRLYFEFERAVEEMKPKYFLLENVKMKQEFADIITQRLGVEPIEINSNLVSAQNRKRIYWTNIPVNELPHDKGIMLADIIHEREEECGIDLENYKVPFDHQLKILDKEVYEGKIGYFRQDSQANRVYSIHGKAVTLCGEAGGGAAKMGQYLFGCLTPDRENKRQMGQRFNDGKKYYTLTAQDKHGIFIDGYIRKLTPIECERLQTLPDGYTEGIKEPQRYKCLGNGWTVDVIAHIFKYLKDKEKEEMELKVKAPTFPEVIEFNFDELKQEITERASTYVNLVYGEEQMQDAKKDRATLNKFVKALSDERIKIKKVCMKPYEDFEAKIKELDRIVNVAIDNIDSQVKGYEEKQKQEKKAKIEEYFAERYLNSGTPAPEFFTLERIFDEKWLNASVSMKSIEDAIDAKAEQVKSDLVTLANLPEFGFEATEVYKRTLDLTTAISEGQKLADMAKRKAEAERLKAEREAEQARLAAEAEAQKQEAVEPVKEAFQADAMNPPEQPKQLVSFKALLTVDQAKELKRFFDDRKIEFYPI